MNAQTFCLYSLVAVSLVWGALGLRFAVSVLVANLILAIFLFSFDASSDNENLRYSLMLAYPLYWGGAFAVFRFLEWPELPTLNITFRLLLGCALAFGFFLGVHWDTLSREGELFRITYCTEPKERVQRLAVFLKQSDEQRLCDESYSTLMRLAVNARDTEVVRLLFDSLASCEGAATTITDTVKPALDNGDAAALELFIQCGLAPDTNVFGYDYANGTALAYAATATGRPDLVRLIAGVSPEKARRLKYRNNMLEKLKEQNNKEMLSVLAQLGIE